MLINVLLQVHVQDCGKIIFCLAADVEEIKFAKGPSYQADLEETKMRRTLLVIIFVFYSLLSYFLFRGQHFQLSELALPMRFQPSISEDRKILSQVVKPFRLLCTALPESYRRLGAYQIRCLDLKTYADKYFPGLLTIDTSPLEMAKLPYNATIMVKSALPYQKNFQDFFGRVFIDVVDRALPKDEIPKQYELIVQNKYHGEVCNFCFYFHFCHFF